MGASGHRTGTQNETAGPDEKVARRDPAVRIALSESRPTRSRSPRSPGSGSAANPLKFHILSNHIRGRNPRCRRRRPYALSAIGTRSTSLRPKREAASLLRGRPSRRVVAWSAGRATRAAPPWDPRCGAAACLLSTAGSTTPASAFRGAVRRSCRTLHRSSGSAVHAQQYPSPW